MNYTDFNYSEVLNNVNESNKEHSKTWTERHGEDLTEPVLTPDEVETIMNTKDETSIIKIYCFKGVRTIQGIPLNQASVEDLKIMNQATFDMPYLLFGHVGFSVNDSKTIYGWGPIVPNGCTFQELVERLLKNEAFPGILTDDTDVFNVAHSMSTLRGWNTTLITKRFVCNNARRLDLFAKIKHGEHGWKYAFPYLNPEQTLIARTSQGNSQPLNNTNADYFLTDKIANCGAFASLFLGVYTGDNPRMNELVQYFKKFQHNFISIII